MALGKKERYIARDPDGTWCVVAVRGGDGYGGAGGCKTWTPLGLPSDLSARNVASLLEVVAAGGVDCRRYARVHLS